MSAGQRIAIAVAAGLVSFLVTACVRRYAGRLRLIDVPNARSSHRQPTPRGGGIALAVVTLCGLALLGPAEIPWPELAALVGGGMLIAGIGLADDRRSQPAALRLVIHTAAACLTLALIGPVRTIAIPGVFTLPLGWLAAPVTILWIVGMINTYNFMDGIDGLAGGQALVAGAGWIWVGAAYELPAVELTGLLAAASSAGFLVHNRPPARIFLGDVGSGLLGFLLAVLALLAARARPELFLVGAVFVWPFLADATVTLVRRAVRRENLLAAHRSHLYQRLVIAGHSHAFVSGLYTAAAALGIAIVVAVLAS